MFKINKKIIMNDAYVGSVIFLALIPRHMIRFGAENNPLFKPVISYGWFIGSYKFSEFYDV